VKQIHISRGERKLQIAEILAERFPQTISTYKLAKLAGVTNSKHFRDFVCEMYGEGLIMGARQKLANGMDRFLWWSLEENKKGKQKERFC
jgi:hypothetical protein